MHVRARLRIDESVSESRALRDEVRDWRARWDAIDAMGSHLTQLDLLAGVVTGLIDEVTARLAAIDPALPAGEAYDACREQDRRLLHARRLWRWYADKLDQRNGPEDDARVQTLEAADEVIWSCWKTAFTVLGETVPPAPVAYLAPQFSASATPRSDPPDGLRPGADDLLREHVEQLPLPVVGLPPACERRPWWLILAAHEASHHIQFEAGQSEAGQPGAGDLEQRTQDAVTRAVGAGAANPAEVRAWQAWCRELFADACSVLLAGPAAIWAVRELETRPAASMTRSPSLTYPPPVVRLAVLESVANQAGIGVPRCHDDPALGAEPDFYRTDGQLLHHVPAVATALLSLTSKPAARPLRDMAEGTVKACAPGGAIAGWRAELTGTDEPVPRHALDAARFCAAAGVEAWQRLSA
ncbi:MAG: hypothetical protein J2P25_22595, partial [Nocardiopsaceae bacterium]|nr:hypothetical protein [Nocardiopsaceae bacterium]